jgi:hypothetical protein
MNNGLRITSNHLTRVAIVYLRQSSAAQVEHNRESELEHAKRRVFGGF